MGQQAVEDTSASTAPRAVGSKVQGAAGAHEVDGGLVRAEAVPAGSERSGPEPVRELVGLAKRSVSNCSRAAAAPMRAVGATSEASDAGRSARVGHVVPLLGWGPSKYGRAQNLICRYYAKNS